MNRNTGRTYRRAWELFLKLSGVNREEIIGMEPKKLTRLIDQVFDRTDYRAGTKRTYIHGVKSYLLEELDIETGRSRVTKLLGKSIPRTSNKKKLSKEEIRKLRDYFRRHYDSADPSLKERALRNLILMELLIFTGQRIGDILKLKVSDARKPVLFFKQEKTGQEVRLENPVMPEILFYSALLHLKEEDPLFASGFHHQPMRYSQAYRIIHDAGLLILSKSISPHCFRTYVITELRMAGKTNAEIQSVSGHANSNMIDYYSVDKPEIVGLKGLLW
jgi:integrase